MKNMFMFAAALLFSTTILAEMSPIYYEGFSRCFDEEDENYGYTGGNDNQWSGDIAKAEVIYQDAPEWNFTYCNGAYQCLKVGTSKKQGSATTPLIACEGEVDLSFRVAPWEGDSLFYLSISGGYTSDKTSYELKQHKWTNITIHITDIKSGIRVTFTSLYKHRFFLDDVCVRPVDPTVGVIRTVEGIMVDFGLLGRSYSSSSRVLTVEGANLKGSITATLEAGETEFFQLSSSTLPSDGGELTITCLPGASVGQHGCYLYLRGKDKTTNKTVEKRVTIMMEVADLNLEGSGTKPDPYTCGDVILLAANEGTVWTGTYYWVTGYVIGGVKRYQDTYDGISYTDNLSLVLAASPDETDDSKYITVQISENARAALNIVDNPELIGQQIKVQGLLLNNNYNPLYLGKPGVRDVRTDAQYERPEKTPSDVEYLTTKEKSVKILINGQVIIERQDGSRYNMLGNRWL